MLVIKGVLSVGFKVNAGITMQSFIYPPIYARHLRKSRVSRDPLKGERGSGECLGKESFFQVAGTVKVQALR